jgi:hypothetical protein
MSKIRFLLLSGSISGFLFVDFYAFSGRSVSPAWGFDLAVTGLGLASS